MGSITVITSGKGGVGKTTVTAGLGTALSRRGKRVLLIDMETGLRGLEKVIGADEFLVFDAADIVSGNCKPMEAVYPCLSVPGLFLLPAPSKSDESITKEQLRKITSLLSPYFDNILIDCPAGIANEFKVSVSAADSALIIINPDPIGLRCSKTVKNLLNEAEITDIRLVINRFNAQKFLEFGLYTDLDEVIDAAGVQLIGIVPEDQNLLKAAVDGTPCPQGLPGTMAFDRIAARLDGETVPLIID